MDFNPQSMPILDLVGHIGFVFLLLGKVLVINKHRWGFCAWAVGAGVWLVLGLHLGLTSLVVWNGVYIVMYAYGFYKWRPLTVKEIE